VLSQPPPAAQTGAPLPLTQVDQPVGLKKFDSDPCGLLTKEQVAAIAPGVRVLLDASSWSAPLGVEARQKPANSR